MHLATIDVTHADRARSLDPCAGPVNQGNERAKNLSSDLNRALTQQYGNRIFIFFKNASDPTRGPDLNMPTLSICEGMAHKLSLPVTFATLGHDLVPDRSA